VCLGSTPSAPPPRDLEAEKLESERKATEKANAETAFRRTQRRKSSLIANAGGAAGTSAISSYTSGKQTLG